MVTVYYLKRFLDFFKGLIAKIKNDNVDISYEVYWWFGEVEKTIIRNKSINHTVCSDKDRMKYVSSLGKILRATEKRYTLMD